jgi:hypothetical protein
VGRTNGPQQEERHIMNVPADCLVESPAKNRPEQRALPATDESLEFGRSAICDPAGDSQVGSVEEPRRDGRRQGWRDLDWPVVIWIGGVHLAALAAPDDAGRALGLVRQSAAETEPLHRSDPLSPMFGNAVAIARMAAGRIADAVPILEDLVVRVPGMSFPVANLLRARAFLGDWEGFDRLLDPAAGHELREFKDGLAFLSAKRDPTPENLGAIRNALESQVERTGAVDLSRLVYAAHLGLVDDAYRAAERARLGPNGTADDVIGVDAYRTGLLFWHGMPELRADPRFVPLCARLGLVDHWLRSNRWPDCADEVPYDFRGECERARAVTPEEFPF